MRSSIKTGVVAVLVHIGFDVAAVGIGSRIAVTVLAIFVGVGISAFVIVVNIDLLVFW